MITLSFKVRNATSSCEYKGTLVDGVPHLFLYEPDRETREKILAACHETHTNMCEWENENEQQKTPD